MKLKAISLIALSAIIATPISVASFAYTDQPKQQMMVEQNMQENVFDIYGVETEHDYSGTPSTIFTVRHGVVPSIGTYGLKIKDELGNEKISISNQVWNMNGSTTLPEVNEELTGNFTFELINNGLVIQSFEFLVKETGRYDYSWLRTSDDSIGVKPSAKVSWNLGNGLEEDFSTIIKPSEIKFILRHYDVNTNNPVEIESETYQNVQDTGLLEHQFLTTQAPGEKYEIEINLKEEDKTDFVIIGSPEQFTTKYNEIITTNTTTQGLRDASVIDVSFKNTEFIFDQKSTIKIDFKDSESNPVELNYSLGTTGQVNTGTEIIYTPDFSGNRGEDIILPSINLTKIPFDTGTELKSDMITYRIMVDGIPQIISDNNLSYSLEDTWVFDDSEFEFIYSHAINKNSQSRINFDWYYELKPGIYNPFGNEVDLTKVVFSDVQNHKIKENYINVVPAKYEAEGEEGTNIGIEINSALFNESDYNSPLPADPRDLYKFLEGRAIYSDTDPTADLTQVNSIYKEMNAITNLPFKDFGPTPIDIPGYYQVVKNNAWIFYLIIGIASTIMLLVMYLVYKIASRRKRVINELNSIAPKWFEQFKTIIRQWIVSVGFEEMIDFEVMSIPELVEVIEGYGFQAPLNEEKNIYVDIASMLTKQEQEFYSEFLEVDLIPTQEEISSHTTMLNKIVNDHTKLTKGEPTNIEEIIIPEFNNSYEGILPIEISDNYFLMKREIEIESQKAEEEEFRILEKQIAEEDAQKAEEDAIALRKLENELKEYEESIAIEEESRNENNEESLEIDEEAEDDDLTSEINTGEGIEIGDSDD